MHRVFLGIGFTFACIAVGADALGTHALAERFDDWRFAWWQQATDYQFVHALGLIGLGLAADRWPSKAWAVAGTMMILGVIIFCGGLYLRALTGSAFFSSVTPIGGGLLIGSWAWSGWVAFTQT